MTNKKPEEKMLWMLDFHTGELIFDERWIVGLHIMYFSSRYRPYNPFEGV